MYIYSSYDYDGTKEKSRELLVRAFDACLHDFAVDQEAASLGIAGKDLVNLIQTNEHGKPYIEDWMHFSISHTENAWAILISNNPCGLDIQFPRDCKISQIAERFYSEEEKKLVAEEGDDAFWRVWARREAAIKAIGKTVLSTIPDTTGESIELEGEKYWMHEVELLGADEPPFGAVCTIEEPLTVHYFRL